MAHKKRRAAEHIMEEKSVNIVRNKIPEEWVMHQYAPDYGIDFVVETFEYIDEQRNIAETLGEFFFVQIKSTENVKTTILTVEAKLNVEKYAEPLSPNQQAKVEVIKYSLDINEITTIQSMGTSVPVLLFLVDLSTEKVYFLCVNDYIEKILLFDEKLNNKFSTTIYIPISNNIENESCLCHLSFLARRSKLFGAFNKFHYQRNELRYNNNSDIVLHFISIIKKYDFWNAKVNWPPLVGMYDELIEIEKFLLMKEKNEKDECSENKGRGEDFYDESPEGTDTIIHGGWFVLPFWDRLCNLSHIYEEICKEWFLPTFFWLNSYEGLSE